MVLTLLWPPLGGVYNDLGRARLSCECEPIVVFRRQARRRSLGSFEQKRNDPVHRPRNCPDPLCVLGDKKSIARTEALTGMLRTTVHTGHD